MGKQARALPFSLSSSPSTSLMAVFHSYLQYLFRPLTSLGLLGILPEEWGKEQEEAICGWNCMLETCLQMYRNVLLMLSRSGLSNTVPLVDAGLTHG